MIALRPVLVPYTSQTLLTSHGKPTLMMKHSNEMSGKKLVYKNRRVGILVITTTAASFSSSLNNIACGLDLRMVAPDQTIEEAKNGIQNHAKGLLQVKDLIELKAWREAQKELRKSSSLLKQDIYTIIQAKPGNERQNLRKLYFNLFNSVSKLDYAARDEDESKVLQCYDKIVLALNEILSEL
ncbi:hypothetical protein Gohar_022207 [Gossypium harknessii]|uniref:PsbQ-like protein 3, chloroplastic n=1 Tax=Gossypium harknessii TaxID=34285 RepID=A0A7J9IE80_9ROSI|nr:hypothetical protein [Gossypium harknessii]